MVFSANVKSTSGVGDDYREEEQGNGRGVGLQLIDEEMFPPGDPVQG